MAELLPAGSRFVGVEYSSELVALAPSPHAEFAVLQGNVARLPPSASQRQYDVVTALAVLEHLSEPQRAFKNAAEVLRSQGLLVATCPAPAWDGIANRLNLLPDHHEARLSIRDLIALAVNAGLDVLETRRFMWAPVGFLPHLHAHVSARRSFEMDGIVRRIRLLDWLFVNQLLVARKP
jgi:SAM-dependent methyltransferase